MLFLVLHLCIALFGLRNATFWFQVWMDGKSIKDFQESWWINDVVAKDWKIQKAANFLHCHKKKRNFNYFWVACVWFWIDISLRSVSFALRMPLRIQILYFSPFPTSINYCGKMYLFFISITLGWFQRCIWLNTKINIAVNFFYPTFFTFFHFTHL